MVTDTETNTVYFSDLLRTDAKHEFCYNEIISALNKHGISHKLLPKTNDIWARDYMPIQTASGNFIEYRYDPDYLLKTNERHLKSYPDIVCDAIGLRTTKTDIILDGGNVIKSSKSVIIVDKAVLENKYKYSKEELEYKLIELLEVDHVIWIPWDKNEYLGHSDGMVRFINNSEVLINHYFDDCSKQFRNKFYSALENQGLKIHKLKFDIKNPDKDLNWAYINYLQIGELILVPKFGIEEDGLALEQIFDYFPNCKVESINMRSVVLNDGALNCISWTIRE